MLQEKINIAQKKLIPVSRQAASEGIVLLENKNEILPIKKGEVISLFGRCQIDTYRSGTGSGGAVNVPYAVSALQGLRDNPRIEINESLVALYQEWIEAHPFDNAGGGWAAEPWFQHEMLLDEMRVEESAQHSDKAIFFIGRTAGEDQDNIDQAGSYRLTDIEITMIERINRHFDRVIIVLNVNNIIDMSWLESIENKQSIQAVLYSWAGGMEGGHALADILSGDQSPSGRLTDSIAYQLDDYPSSANFGRPDFNLYQEDIYLGYRYFETFDRDAIQYAFGAGLSYTTFSHTLVSHSIEGTGIDQILHFDFEIKNTGARYNSKEVVQLYVESPQGKLGKPARVLVAFAKSRLLSPSETQVITLSVAIKSLASFDDSGATGHINAYVVEPGCYKFYAGGSVRQAKRITASMALNSVLVTEQLSEVLAPIKDFERLKPGKKLNNGLYEASYENVPNRTVSLEQRIKENLPTAYALTGDKGFKLNDVKLGNISLSVFIAQLTPAQLATITRGEGMCSPKVTPGTAAAFGGVSESLFNLGIPVAAAADGPSGIRMDSGHKATQVAIGTLLGCTWNSELNEQLFYLVGKELYANQIDTLLGPGINIHRHPLNGRNFEYFSEDALLTGIMASAQTRGLHQAGVSGTIKHFAANDQETARVDVDSVISQRALREIHLKPFEMAVKEGNASTIMTAYNPINGHWAPSNYDLNSTILREEWGFKGIVMTDWWAKMNCPINAGIEAKTFTSFMIRAQNDLYMVVENDGAEKNVMSDDTLEALDNGTLTLGELQRSAMNICQFIMQTPVMERPLKAYEPVKQFYADKTLSANNCIAIEEEIKISRDTNLSVVIDVAEQGTYQCRALVHYDRDALAQSSCSLSFNGEFSMSLAVNGTNGELVTIEGLQVKLEKGRYELSIDFVKVGLTLEHILFTKS